MEPKRSLIGGAAVSRDKMREAHIRFAVEFILDDPRCARLSDAAGWLYVRLEALAMQAKREVLPADYTIDELSGRFRRSSKALEEALAELAAGARPLIKRMPDGRIWVVGIQKKHGARFVWKDTPPDEICTAPAQVCATPAIADTVGMSTTQMVHTCQISATYDGEVEQEVEQDPPPTPPPPVRKHAESDSPHDVTATTAGIVHKWGNGTAGNGFKHEIALRQLMRHFDRADPITLLAHVREVDLANGLRDKRAALYARLQPKGKVKQLLPSDMAFAWAKERMAMDGHQPRGGPPGQVGHSLAQGAV